MKKVVMSVVAALAVAGMAVPAVAADMPVKAKPMAEPAPPPSPFDVAFGTAFTTDYEFRGLSQTNHKPAVQGYFELDYTAAPWLTLYAGLWGSNVSFADAEFDITGGGRFSFGIFGLDLGYLYYAYPDPTGGVSISFGEFYAKPSVKITDWLTVGGMIMGGGDFGHLSQSAWYYEGNASIALPTATALGGINTTISGAVGRQTYDSTLTSLAFGFVDYTTWNVGIAFNYKAITLDLRYWDTNIDQTSAPVQCGAPFTGVVDACKSTFVATLKFDTTLSALK